MDREVYRDEDEGKSTGIARSLFGNLISLLR